MHPSPIQCWCTSRQLTHQNTSLYVSLPSRNLKNKFCIAYVIIFFTHIYLVNVFFLWTSLCSSSGASWFPWESMVRNHLHFLFVHQHLVTQTNLALLSFIITIIFVFVEALLSVISSKCTSHQFYILMKISPIPCWCTSHQFTYCSTFLHASLPSSYPQF